MTQMQAFITIMMCVIGTMITRFLPFILFPENKETPEWVQYLGKVLPLAIMATLVVYCLRGTTFDVVANFIPQIVAVAATVGIHLWKRNTLLSVFGGTAIYMCLVQLIF